MSKPLRDHIAKLVSTPVWESGCKRFEEGAVLDLQGDPKAVQARVANDRGQFEQVRIGFRKDGFGTRCTCREFGSVCSHAVAALLRIAEDMPECFGFMACVDECPTEEKDTSASTSNKPQTNRMDRPFAVSSLSPGRKVLPKYSIDSLIAAPRVLAELRLHIRQQAKALDVGAGTVTVRACLIYGGREYSVGNIRKLVDGVEAAGGMDLSDFPLQEQQAMRFLAAHGELSSANYKLAVEHAADLLHCLIGFEHLYCDGEHVQVHRDYAQPVLRLSKSENRQVVTPRVMLPGHGLLPLGTVLPIVGRGGVWIGVQGHYWWLPGIVDAGWLRFLIRGESNQVGAEDIQQLTQACERSRGAIRLVVDDEKRGDLQIKAGTCRPVLTLDWDKRRVDAVLELDYDGVRLPVGRSGSAWAGNDVVIRDPVAEDKAVERLRIMGFAQNPALLDHFRLTSQAKLWQFLKAGLDELGQDWKLYSSQEFDAKRASSAELQLKVQTHAETDSWFELSCDMLSAGGLDLKWDDVMNAFSKGGEFLTLANGTLIRIPDEIRQLMEFLQRRALTQTDNLFRFHIYSALPIADSLKPYVTGKPANWRTLRDRLTSGVNRPEVELPSPLDETLRDYQKDGVVWMSVLAENGFHGILADEMGLGKTIQALAMLSWRRQTQKKHKPSLVVCPTSLIENWLLEAERFAPELKSLAILGQERLEMFVQLPERDLVITSYALLRRDIAQYTAVDFDYVILDEAQHIKNPGTANAKTCKSLRSDHRLILTGTPLENSVREVWSLFDFLLPGLLGTQQDFRKIYEVPVGGSGAAEAAGRLGSVLKPFILRRTKDDVCKQLPPKMEQVMFCHLDPRQQRLHQNLLAAGREMVRMAREQGWNTCRFELLSLLMRLRQLCCHPSLLPEELRAVEDDVIPSAKTELLQELILEAIDGGHRILLFSQFTSFLGLIQPWLKEEGIAYEYMDGNTRDRQARVDRFNNDPSIPLFLLSLKAGGTGLNLTGADTVILYDPWWNPMVEDQATDRIHRIGQEKPVTAYKLVAHHSIEEKVLQLQENKRELFDQLMAGVPAKVGDLTPEDFEFLFSEEA